MIKIRDKYKERRFVIYAFIAGLAILFLIRLIFLQLINDDYLLLAQNNTLRNITVHPPRGLIYDRHGQLLVYNQNVYDLMVVYNNVKTMDTAEFCKILGIDRKGFLKRMKKARVRGRYKGILFEKQISNTTAAYLREKLYKFPGFYFVPRTLRKYPRPVAAHCLGYIGEVNQKDIDGDSAYAAGDYIGKSGIEKTYEYYLRGVKGIKKLLVDNLNREKGSFANGRYDIPAVTGKNLYTGLDLTLQAYGEQLMRNKKGAIVAIEPSTGEILAMVSAPSYDPNRLVGRIRTANYSILLKDSLKPLLNRALNSAYPPGSTFKLINALIGEQEGVLFRGTRYACHGGATFGGVHVGCHHHESPLDLVGSVQHSCNAYYCNVYRSIVENKKYRSYEEGFRHWRAYTLKMGFGHRFPVDLPYERSGNIPTPEYYDRYYGRGHWSAVTTISLAIGQGEILATPLQMANEAAFIANRGFYYIPHIVSKIEGVDTANSRFRKRHWSGIDRKYFDPVIEGMAKVTLPGGTALLAHLDSIEICGKTGTAQNPHGEDHSVFIAFAPRQNPKIAIAVFVENSGFGGTWAAPISSLMIEKYLNGHIATRRKWIEKRMLEGDLIH